MSQPKIFLSYANEDREKVEALYDTLKAEDFKPWMANKDILPGQFWAKEIERAIRQTDFFVVCLSRHSIYKRGMIQKEIKDAWGIWEQQLEDDIYLIPVRLEACEIPSMLRQLQAADIFTPQGKARLIKAIRVGMAKRNIEPRHRREQESVFEDLPPTDTPDIDTRSTNGEISPESLVIIHEDSRQSKQTALVLAISSKAKMGDLVEILVDKWDLPVWDGRPIGYNLMLLPSEELMTADTRLTDLNVGVEGRLKMVPVFDQLVMSQSPPNIPVFDVSDTEKQCKITVLAFPASVTTMALQDRLEALLDLPSVVDGEPVYYELTQPNGPLQPLALLIDEGIGKGADLELHRRCGIRIIDFDASD